MRPLFEPATRGTRIAAGVIVLFLTLLIIVGLVPFLFGLALEVGLSHTDTFEIAFDRGLLILIAAIPFVGIWLAVRLFRKPKNMGGVTDKADGD